MADINPQQPYSNEAEHESNALIESVTAEFVADAAGTETPRDESGRFKARGEESEDQPEALAEADPNDAAPDEDQPSGEEDGDEPESEDDPPIDPPASWTKEQRDAWNALTPQAKQVVLERETARDAEVRRVQNEAADERKAAKAEREATAQERRQYADNLKAIHQLQAVIDPVLAEGNQTDWVKLAKDDPAGYVAKAAEYQQRLNIFQAVQAEIQQVTQRQNAESRADYAKRLADEYPDLTDAVKGKAVKESWMPTLKHVGFSDAEIEQGWGIPHEPRYFKILDLATKQIRAEAERAKIGDKKVAPQPTKTVKPRAADSGAKGKSASVVALEKRARETGRTDDMANYVLAELGLK